MKYGTMGFVFVAAVVFAFAGCKPAVRKDQGQVLASVNGVFITVDDVLIQLGGHGEFMSTPMKDEALDNIINDELQYQKALSLGLDKDDKFQSRIRLMEKKIDAYKRAEMARRIRDTQVAAKIQVTGQDIREYYDTHAAEITADLHLGVLQFSDEVQAKAALARIRGGASFEKIAVEQTAHAPQAPAWDKGYLRWNEIPTEVLDPVYRLNKGEVSDVLKAQSGIYLIKIIDRKKNATVNFEKMKAGILNRLNSIRTVEAQNRYIQQLRSEAQIKKY